MYYEFYIDQFFIEQFFCGYLLLAAAGWLTRTSLPWRRLVLGSLASTACMTAAICLGLPQLYLSAFFAGAVSTLWKRPLKRERRRNLSRTFCLLAVTLCFGGSLEALVTLFPLPLTAAITISSAIAYILPGYLRQQVHDKESTASVILYRKGKSVTLEGFPDTGNQLTEPVTGQPVSIADEKSLEPLLGRGWEEKQGFRLIPYHSLGTEDGWLRGVTFDEMIVITGSGSHVFQRPVIALYHRNVSARKNYQVILHPEHMP